MNKFPKDFLLGASTAAHQVEGNNIYSDYWAMEQLEHSNFDEPSLDAVDHYHRYEEDILLMEKVGLNAYRFSIEWARIEPVQGKYDANEIAHYRKVLECCHKHGITPIVTMHHFSSPKWLITRGGWEWDGIESVFPAYCRYVVENLGDLMEYVCTINEANMGLQIASVAMSMMKSMGIAPQVGMNFEEMIESYMPESRKQQKKEMETAFETKEAIHDFLSMRTENGDNIMIRAHSAARRAMKECCPHLKVGMTFSLYDIQVKEGGEELAHKEWEEHFGHYSKVLQDDDFIGVQNYSRKIIGPQGDMGIPEGAEVTQMDYEYYPQGIAHVVRRVAEELPGKELIITENGIATLDDSRRQEFIKTALTELEACVVDGIPLKGYLHWSLMDNFEWQKGYSKNFGLIAVDRTTQVRAPKESLFLLGNFRRG